MKLKYSIHASADADPAPAEAPPIREAWRPESLVSRRTCQPLQLVSSTSAQHRTTQRPYPAGKQAHESGQIAAARLVIFTISTTRTDKQETPLHCHPLVLARGISDGVLAFLARSSRFEIFILLLTQAVLEKRLIPHLLLILLPYVNVPPSTSIPKSRSDANRTPPNKVEHRAREQPKMGKR